MPEVEVVRRGSVDEADFARLEPVLRGHESLSDALDWSRALELGPNATDVVIQDEYTHDVVIRVAESLFVVYDST